MNLLNSVDRSAVDASSVAFITLTYPGQAVESWGQAWPKEPELWKRHLDTFGKRLRRAYGPLAAVWKQEQQQRGAPHFHVMVITPDGTGIRRLREWVAVNWFEVVGSGQADHLEHGTDCERVRSWRGVISYAAKYLGKAGSFVDRLTGEILPIGRFWGVWGRELLPISIKEYSLSRSEWMQYRRWVRRAAGLGSGGRLGSVCAYLREEVWKRLLVLVQGRERVAAEEAARVIERALMT